MDNPPLTSGTNSRATPAVPFWAAARHGLLAALFASVALAILVSPVGREAQPTYNLNIGDVASADISAPRSITYISSIQTTAQQQSALAAVAPIFDPPDGRIARTQLAAAQAALASITALRSDASLQAPQKLTNLQLTSGANLDAAAAQIILELTEARWQAVATDTLRVLETTLRDPVRANALAAARAAAADRTSMLLSPAEGRIAATLAAEWIVPNSLYNEPATKLARQAALDATLSVNQNFLAGQTVLRRGSIVRPEDLEALTQLGLLRGSTNWLKLLLPPTLIVVLVTVLFALYVRTQLPEYITNTRHLLFIIFLVHLFLLGAKVLVTQRVLLPFLFPGAALGLLIAVALQPQLGLFTSVLFCMLLSLVADGRMDVTLFHLAGSMLAILAVGRAERVNAYFWSGVALAAGNTALLLTLHLADPVLDWQGILQLLSAGLANGLVTASVTLLGLFLLSYVFDITTTLQLVELSRPDHPLLLQLLRAAPGSYQHSLQVSNLAEHAAQQIGANALLVRVGAMFHDIGKSVRPEYFIENQIETVNPHDSLDPYTSARIIIDHVRAGEELARKYRLPQVIRAAITEHHGTIVTQFQYQRAVQEGANTGATVPIEDYCYPGPKPQSRETALLLLADGCEAKSRAELPATADAIDKLVGSIISARLQQRQLIEAHLTLADLEAVRLSFDKTLQGFFHSRLKYPEWQAPPDGDAQTNAALSAAPSS